MLSKIERYFLTLTRPSGVRVDPKWIGSDSRIGRRVRVNSVTDVGHVCT